MTTQESLTDKLGFEMEGCSRCGGTGHYSFHLTYGTICFKCAGKTKVYTKRGHTARKFYDTLLSVPAKDLQAGQQFLYEFLSKSFWITVTEVQSGENTCLINAIDKRGDYAGMHVKPDMMIRILPTREQQQKALEQALEYQETLTKTGQPRKGKVA